MEYFPIITEGHDEYASGVVGSAASAMKPIVFKTD